MRSTDPDEVAVSALTVAALQARAEVSRSPQQNRMALEQFLLPLHVVEFDADAARQLADVIAFWGVQPGGEAGLAQMLAAQALQLGATLVSVQPQQYAPVPGLHVNGAAVAALLDWPEPPRRAPADAASSHGARTAQRVGSHRRRGQSRHDARPAGRLPAQPASGRHARFRTRGQPGRPVGAAAQRSASGRFASAGRGDRRLQPDAYPSAMLTPHGVHVVLLGFVSRQQGLILARGNPKRIESVADLARDDVRFVNRQQGAGTRLLLDHALDELGMDAAQIRGYEREESSHAAVAAAIIGGEADCGLGIQAAAQTHDLAFVPLFSERYDLVIPVEHYESELLAPLLDLLRSPSPAFLGRVAALGGYDMTDMGRVLAEI